MSCRGFRARFDVDRIAREGTIHNGLWSRCSGLGKGQEPEEKCGSEASPDWQIQLIIVSWLRVTWLAILECCEPGFELVGGTDHVSECVGCGFLPETYPNVTGYKLRSPGKCCHGVVM